MNTDAWLKEVSERCAKVSAEVEMDRDRLREYIAKVRHTVEWHKERDRYLADARAGRDRDFALSDVEATADACVELVQALDLSPEDFKLRAELVLSSLILKAADAHTSQCEANGTL